MDNMHSTNNIEDLRLSNLRKDPVAKFRGGGTGSGDKSKKCYRNSSSRAYPWRDDGEGEELRITFDLPTDAAERLEAFAKKCLDDEEKVDSANKPHYELLDLGIKSLQFQGNQKVSFYKTRPSTSSKEQPGSSKNASSAPSLLINLLNQDSGSHKVTENYLTDEDKKVRLKLKMPGSTSLTGLTTPKLPSETSLSVVSSAPPKVPKLIVSMRNKTIKTSSGTKDNDSNNQRKRSNEDIRSKHIQEILPNTAPSGTKTTSKTTKESMETTVPQCLNSATIGRSVSKKVNGSSIKVANILTGEASPCSSPPSSILSSLSPSNPTKMVPVKLVTVTKGEGNVRLVRVSPVRNSSSAKLSIPPSASSSDSQKNKILVNGNNAAEEVPSSLETDSDEHNPSRKRPSRDLNPHECVSKKQGDGTTIIDNRHLTKT